jgi:hypothetical protein
MIKGLLRVECGHIMADYTVVNLKQVEDMAPTFGLW